VPCAARRPFPRGAEDATVPRGAASGKEWAPPARLRQPARRFVRAGRRDSAKETAGSAPAGILDRMPIRIRRKPNPIPDRKVTASDQNW